MGLGKWWAGLENARRDASDRAGTDAAQQAQSAERLRRIADREIAAALAQSDRLADAKATRSPQVAAAVKAARTRPIVFREIYPPPAEPGLSFYGGVPIGPAGMAWPRGLSDNRPLTFLMQWQASALAAQDATGLLPRDGVLYLFSSLRWGEKMMFVFVHEAGATDGWAALPIPDDLPDAWGDGAAHASPFVSNQMPIEQRKPPRLQPHWPFTPIAIDYAASERDDDGDPRFWRDSPAIQETLMLAQDPEGRLVPDPLGPTLPFARPFPTFPHDWAAVRVVAAAVLDARVADWQWRRVASAIVETDRAAMTAAWHAEAQALYAEAIHHPLGEAIPPALSDALWDRMRAFEILLWQFAYTVASCVNVSLGLGSQGAAAIPASLIEAGARWHSLGYAWLRKEYNHEFDRRMGSGDALEEAKAIWRESRSDEDMARIQTIETELSAAYEQAKANDALDQVRELWAPTPNRMLGVPSFIQGDVEEYVEDRILLFELTSSDSIGLRLGDGVCQFMIRPDDLAARRFDRIETVCGSS